MSVLKTWVLRAGQPSMQPSLQKAAPVGLILLAVTSNVASTHGRKNRLLVMVHEPTV